MIMPCKHHFTAKEIDDDIDNIVSNLYLYQWLYNNEPVTPQQMADIGEADYSSYELTDKGKTIWTAGFMDAAEKDDWYNPSDDINYWFNSFEFDDYGDPYEIGFEFFKNNKPMIMANY